MSLFDGLAIAGSGMAAQRFRMNTIASNLANARTTRTPAGGPYRRMDPVFVAAPVEQDDPFAETLDAVLRGVQVAGVVRDPGPFQLVYDPGHPDADANGYVRMPNVQVVEEMVNLVTASRSFEANVQTFQTLRDMMLRAIEIGR